MFGHRDIVSCLDFSTERGIHGNPGEGLVATGSHDATVLLWRWSSRRNRVVGLVAGEEGEFLAIALLSYFIVLFTTLSNSIYPSPSFSPMSSSLSNNYPPTVDSPTPIAVLTGHEQSIACVSVNCNLGLTISGAKCKFYSLALSLSPYKALAYVCDCSIGIHIS